MNSLALGVRRLAALALVLLVACGDGRLSPQGGTIVGVTAGTGLTGGGTSGIVTMNVACGFGLLCASDSVALDNTSIPAGSGATNYLPRWTPDGNHLGNSLVSQNTTTTGLSFTTVDVGVNPYPSTGSWSTAPGWLVVGPNATTGTAGNLGIGWSTSMDGATISSIAPGVAWKSMYFSAQSFAFRPQGDYNTMEVSITTTGLTVAQNLTVGNDASSDRTTLTGGLRTITTSAPDLGALTSWDNQYAVFGPSAASNTGAGVGIGYNSTYDLGLIVSVAPNVAYKPLVLASNSTQFYNGSTTAMTVASTAAINVNTTIGTSTSNSHTVNGQIVFQGTNWASIINYTGSVNQDAYIRAGVTAGFVNIGDVNTGGVNIGGTNNPTDVNSTLTKFGGAVDGALYIADNVLSAGYSTNGLTEIAFNYNGYLNSTTQFRDATFYDGKQAQACKITGSTKTLNCVGGLQVNGTTVPAGTGTLNYIPLWTPDGSRLGNSPLSSTGTQINSAAQNFAINTAAATSPQLHFVQSGQVTLLFYNPASTDDVRWWNSSYGDTMTLTKFGDLTVKGSSANTQSTINIINSNTGGRTYQLISADSSSALSPSKFVLYDPNSVGTVFAVDASGNITESYNHTVNGNTVLGNATTDTTTINGQTLIKAPAADEKVLKLRDHTNVSGVDFVINGAIGGSTATMVKDHNGTNLLEWENGNTHVYGPLTARGTFAVLGTTTLGDAAVDTVDVNADLAKFGFTDGGTFIAGNEIDGEYSVNATASLYINYHGYNGGLTQFRNLDIRDGKGNQACIITGSTKTLNCIGGLQVNGVDVGVSTSVSGTTNRVAKFTSSSAVGNTAYPIDDASGALTLGDANTDVGTWTGAQIVNNSATGVTADNPLIKINDTRTETAGDSTSTFHIYGAQINMTNSVARDGVAPGGPTGARGLQITSVMTPTGSCGAESTCYAINQGIRLAVSGGDANRAIVSSAGDWLLGGSGSLFVGSFTGDAKVVSGVTASITGSTGDIYTAGNLQVDGSTILGNAVGDTLTVNGNYSYWNAQDAVLEGIGSVYLYSNYDNSGAGNLYLQDATTDGTYLYGNFAMTSAGGGVTPFQMTVGAQAWGMRIAGGGNDLFQLGTVGGTIASFSFGPSAISGTAEFKITTTTVSTPVNFQVDGSTTLGNNITDTTTINGNTNVVGNTSGNAFGVSVGANPTTFWVASNQSVNTANNTNLGDDYTDVTTITGTATVAAGAPTSNAGPSGTVLTVQNANSSHTYLTLRGGTGGTISGINFANTNASQDGAIVYINSLHGMQFMTNQTYRMYLDPSGTLMLGMSGGAVAGGVPVLQSTNTNTGQTASYAQIDISAAGSFDATASTRVSVGESISVTSTRSAGSNSLTNKGFTVTSSGAQTNIAIETSDGDNRFNYTSGASTFYGDTNVGDASTDTFTLTGIFSANGTTTGTSGIGQVLTNVGGLPKWNQPANEYAAKRYEWFDEWLQVGLTTITSTNVNYAPIGSAYQASLSGTGAQLLGAPGGATSFSNRPGVMSLETGTSTTGLALIRTTIDAVDFNTGNWYTSNVVYFPTLSDGTNTYVALTGFWDASSAKAGPTDGCYAFYDSQSVMTGHTGLATGNKWKFACSQNGTRTQVILDGTTQGGITTVDTAVAATTWYRVEITVTGTSSAFVTINGVKAATITTNIPSGTSRTTGFGVAIEKSAGTTSRQIYLDQSEAVFDQTTARSP